MSAYNGLYKYLGDNQVKLSIRRGMLRFSLHAYNNMDDVNRVLELSKKFLACAHVSMNRGVQPEC